MLLLPFTNTTSDGNLHPEADGTKYTEELHATCQTCGSEANAHSICIVMLVLIIDSIVRFQGSCATIAPSGQIVGVGRAVPAL
jgi:hypothetical protein